MDRRSGVTPPTLRTLLPNQGIGLSAEIGLFRDPKSYGYRAKYPFCCQPAPHSCTHTHVLCCMPELHWHRLARTSANSQSCQNCQSPPRLAAEHLFAEMAHHELSLRAVRFTGCDQVALCSLQSRQPIQSSCAPYRRGAAALRRLDGSVSAKKASTLTIEGFLLLNSDLTSTFQTLD